LDIAFGILVVVVLLNVVIAIVSDSWEEAKGIANSTFWYSRVNVLSETFFSFSSQSDKSSFFLFRWVDSFQWIPFGEHIHWTKDEPYTSVLSREQYQFPTDHFEDEIAQKILHARSLESDLYWLRKAEAERIEREEIDGVRLWSRVVFALCKLNVQLGIAAVKWGTGNSLYVFWMLVGIPTFGMLWPVEVREAILSRTTSMG